MASSTCDAPANLLSLWPRGAGVGLPLLVATLAINLLGLALPLAALQVYDKVLAQGAHESWLITMVVVAAAAAVEAVLRLARARLTTWCGSVQEQRLGAATLAHLLRSPPQLGTPASGLHTLEALARLREFSSGQALTVLLEVPFMVVFLALVGYLGGALVLVPLGLLMLFATRMCWQGQSLHNALAERDAAEVARKDVLIETLEHINPLKAFAAVRTQQRVLDGLQRKVSNAALQVARVSSLAYQDGLLCGQLMLMGVVMAGTPMVLNQALSLGALMACVLLAGRLMVPLQRALGLYARVHEAQLALERVQDTMAMPLVFGEADVTATDAPATLRMFEIGLRGEGEEGRPGPWLVRRLNLTLERGQVVLLEDADGATATALLHAMAGLAVPAEGKVELNGMQPHTLGSSSLLGHVGYLPPVGAIYRGTIYENISRFGQTPETQVAEIIKLLDLRQPFSALPHGLSTQLEETLADPLPPGLKQRIALARVLAVRPRVLLFNQADRALDKAGYNAVYNLLARLKGKVLLVLNTADRNLAGLATHTLKQQGTTFLFTEREPLKTRKGLAA